MTLADHCFNVTMCSYSYTAKLEIQSSELHFVTHSYSSHPFLCALGFQCRVNVPDVQILFFHKEFQ